MGGRVIHKGNAEYLVRGVGWIGVDGDAIKDIEKIVVKVEPHKGTPIYVSNLATVSLFRNTIGPFDHREIGCWMGSTPR